MPSPIVTANEFPLDLVWDAMQAVLVAQLPGVDVAAAGAKDFDDEGMLILSPPAVRGVFLGERAESHENQHISYDAVQSYAVLCVAQDLSADNQQQRRASAQLLAQVKHVLTGARLLIAAAAGDVPEAVSEPVIYLSAEPMPTRDIGMAYVAIFEVPGIAQFPAPNA